MVDNVSCVQGFAQGLVIIHWPHVSTASLSKGWGFRGVHKVFLHCSHVPCLSRSCVGREGHGHLVYKYTWSVGCCATWCNMPVPPSCHSLVAFKPSSLYKY